jgi:hypothetical protein
VGPCALTSRLILTPSDAIRDYLIQVGMLMS